MLREQKEISEIYNLKHRFDDYEKGFDYSEKLLSKSISPHLYNNPNMAGFLTRLNNMVVLMVEQTLYLRNLKSFFVDKFYNDHVN